MSLRSLCGPKCAAHHELEMEPGPVENAGGSDPGPGWGDQQATVMDVTCSGVLHQQERPLGRPRCIKRTKCVHRRMGKRKTRGLGAISFAAWELSD